MEGLTAVVFGVSLHKHWKGAQMERNALGFGTLYDHITIIGHSVLEYLGVVHEHARYAVSSSRRLGSCVWTRRMLNSILLVPAFRCSETRLLVGRDPFCSRKSQLCLPRLSS
jgi:hypothetical protein